MREKLQNLGLLPLGRSFHPPSEERIAALEKVLERPLPAPYREFLATYGVCTFEDYVTFVLPDGPRMDLAIFLGIDPDDAYDIEQVWRSLSQEHPATLIPFAIDAYGNALCLDLAPPRFGHVRYIDHENGLESTIAPSFSAFIDVLRRET